MEGETVCVTGASGFIGSWLVKRLLQRGYFVRATVRDPGNEAFYKSLTKGARAVHIDDVCSAHIFLFENPQANGRYICSSHDFTILDLAKSLSQKYPEYNVPTKFEGVDESMKVIPYSPKKLMDLGFTFKYDSGKYDLGDLCAEAIEFCKEKGLL